MISKYKIHLIFAIPLFILFVIFTIIPYSKLFSFDEKKEISSQKTIFELEELEKINDFLSKIDDKKINDSEIKNTLDLLKKEFSLEKEKILAKKELELAKIEKDKKLKEEEKIKREKLEKEKLEEEKKKEIIYPKEFDITNKLAKLHIQERNLSCEAAATTDILSTILKKDIAEKDILAKMKKDITYWKPSYKNSEWKLIWWDPSNGFVWEMDWHQYNLTWYAIYEKPMSEIYTDYWVKTELYNKFENKLGLKNTKEALSFMLKELVKWNYVQMWWDYCTDPDFEDWNIDRKITTEESLNWLSQKNFCYSFYNERVVTWYTEEWKEIKAWKQSHNFVLLGYIWDINNPEKIIIWDTQTWKHIYPTAERLRKWELNDARAIIVYNNKKEDKKTEKVLELEETKTIIDKLNNKEKETKDDLKIQEKAKRREENDEEKN